MGAEPQTIVTTPPAAAAPAAEMVIPTNPAAAMDPAQFAEALAREEKRRAEAQGRMLAATKEAAELRRSEQDSRDELLRAQTRFDDLERQVRELSQQRQQASPQAAADPFADVLDEYGTVDGTKLVSALRQAMQEQAQQVAAYTQQAVGRVASGMGDIQKERLLAQVPNSPHKEDFRRYFDRYLAESGPWAHDPKAVQYAYTLAVGQMQIEGKPVFNVVGAAPAPAAPAYGGPAPMGSVSDIPAGPDFQPGVGTDAAEFVPDTSISLDPGDFNSMRRLADLDAALRDRNLGGVQQMLGKVQRELHAAKGAQ